VGHTVVLELIVRSRPFSIAISELMTVVLGLGGMKAPTNPSAAMIEANAIFIFEWYNKFSKQANSLPTAAFLI